MRHWVRALWWGLFLLAVTFLVLGDHQYYRLNRAFAPIREAAGSDEAFVVAAAAHVHERHRRFSKGPRAKTDNPDSAAYRYPLTLLDGGGGCSQRSALLVAVLQASGIPARKLLIGLTKDFAHHVVVEALVDGEWRVLDPLFGYAYRRESGELATAEDLKARPELVERVVRADPDPFPIPYRLDAFNYRAVTRFNWFRLPMTRAIRAQVGPAADGWATPAIWERPYGLPALFFALMLIPVTCVYLRVRTTAAAASRDVV